MNALTHEAAIALAPTSMIADTLRDTIIWEIEHSNEGSEKALDMLRNGASQLAALALGTGWHDPHDSFTQAHAAAVRGGIAANHARGILVAAFKNDYGLSRPEYAASGEQDRKTDWSAEVHRALALAEGPKAKLATLETIAIEASDAVTANLSRPEAIDILVEAAEAHGLIGWYGRATIEHVCGMALNGQHALAREVEAEEAPSGLDKKGRTLISTRASAVEIEHVEWLMPGRIAVGTQTVIAGMPGTGKSTLAAEIAALVTTGGQWPTGGNAPLGNVLLLSAEDSAQNTIVPRLMAANANLNRIEIIQGTRAEGRRKTFNLAADVDLLEQAANRLTNVKLIVVDPLSAYFGGVDARKNADVRSALEPLGEFAERMGISVLSITHLNKSGQGAALNRVIDSIAIVGAARAAYMIGKDPDDEARRIVASLKNNLAAEAVPLAYRLGQCLVGERQVVASHVLWDSEPVDVTIGDILAAADTNGGNRSARDEAVQFLRELLESGPIPADDVKAQSEVAGMSWATVKRAKNKAQVIATRRGEPGVRGGGRWYWSLQGDHAAG